MTFGSPASVPRAASQDGARRQQTWTKNLFPGGALVAPGDSDLIPAAGYEGAITLWLHKTTTDTPTFDVQGTLDDIDEVGAGTAWTHCGFVVLGSNANIRAVGPVAFGAGDPTDVFLAILDTFATLKVTIAGAPAAGYHITGKALLTPQ